MNNSDYVKTDGFPRRLKFGKHLPKRRGRGNAVTGRDADGSLGSPSQPRYPPPHPHTSTTVCALRAGDQCFTFPGHAWPRIVCVHFPSFCVWSVHERAEAAPSTPNLLVAENYLSPLESKVLSTGKGQHLREHQEMFHENVTPRKAQGP